MSPRLSSFIRENSEAIISEWEAFAATLLPAASGMDSLALRDHAPQILDAIATDLDTEQTSEAQVAKSQGRAEPPLHGRETAAQTHAVMRARGGFDINQLVAEYRALRASVLKLWMQEAISDETGIGDIVRFNEAIDQAVAESVGHFHAQVERARNLLLGMLGHDMRSPLNTVMATARHLAALNAGEQVSAAAARLIRSGASLQALLDDLVDFNRANLGLGIRINPAEVDLSLRVHDEVEQLCGAYPQRRIELTVDGDCRGFWDAGKLQQSLRNLVSNAMRHADCGTPVQVVLRGEARSVCLSVTNCGPVISQSALAQIFDPLKQGGDAAARQDAGSLGLGLFIVREVARAHDGEVDAASGDGRTTFTLRLPRRTAAGSS